MTLGSRTSRQGRSIDLKKNYAVLLSLKFYHVFFFFGN